PGNTLLTQLTMYASAMRPAAIRRMYSGTGVCAGQAHWQSTTRWKVSGLRISVGFTAPPWLAAGRAGIARGVEHRTNSAGRHSAGGTRGRSSSVAVFSRIAVARRAAMVPDATCPRLTHRTIVRYSWRP